jgi:hemerythrin superfamily protein
MFKATEVIAKGVGKTKAAAAAIAGLRGIFKTLAEEHGEVTVLLKRAAVSSEPDTRGQLFPKIRKELLSHERAEMEVLYSALRDTGSEGQRLAEHHDREAGEMEALIEQLGVLPYANEEWAEKLEQLAQLVRHHAHEEEEELFPKAQAIFGERVTRVLDQKYAAKKKAIMTSMS